MRQGGDAADAAERPKGPDKAVVKEVLASGEWLRKNYEDISLRYAGRHIAVTHEEVFDGPTEQEAYRKAKEKYPDANPFMHFVPPKDVVLILPALNDKRLLQTHAHVLRP